MDPGNAVTEPGYMLDRGYRESARLHVQHYMWGQNFGWQLHPEVPRSENLRVIDVGAGNACWLVEIARLLPLSATLVGVDISTQQFPARQFIPSNVRLEILDALGEIPEHYVGSFDVVHLRALSTLIKNNDPGRLVDNIMTLLRPGGFVQWDELDCATLSAKSPHSSISGQQTERLLQRWLEFAAKTNIDWRWLRSIPEHLEARKAVVLRWERAPTRPELFKASTDEFSLALFDIGRIASSISADLLGTADEWRTMYEAMLKETAQGVSITMEMMMAIARKPML